MDSIDNSHVSSPNFWMSFLPQPVNALLEASGLVPSTTNSSNNATTTNASHHSELPSATTFIALSRSTSQRLRDRGIDTGGQVTIRIIDDHEEDVEAGLDGRSSSGGGGTGAPSTSTSSASLPPPVVILAASPRLADVEEGGGGGVGGVGSNSQEENARDGSNINSQRYYNFQPLARWTEQVLPFAVLLLLVFVRQHLQGIAVAFWMTATLVWANDILRRQIALKGEQKRAVTLCLATLLIFHLMGVYWWYQDVLWRPLFLLPLRKLPKFWHAVFVITVNDVMVRQAGIAIKCILLLTFKSTRGRHFRRQGQVLTALEYLLILYRALIPAPVWYRFFLNKEYGKWFSSLTTGLYLTLKLTSVIEKSKTFVAAARVLSRSEIAYGLRSTSEEILAAGDMCAICQEKMHFPITLRCKHIFCEDCVSEWFERERTCPLCRAVVKPAEFKSFADGSTSLLIQFF